MNSEDQWRYIERMEKDVREIKDCLVSLPQALENKFLTHKEFRARFDPVRSLVYGAVALGGLAIFGALMRLVIIK